MSRKKTLLLILAPAAALLGSLPWWGGSYALIWIFLLSVHLTLALSYDIVGGYTGYINLGHSTSFGLGAYAATILLNHGLGLLVSLASAALMAGAFAAIVGYPLFRLRGPYFAMGAFGLISLMEMACTNLRDLTGGSGGLSAPPGNHGLGAYYLGVAAVAGTMILSRQVARSRFGLGLFSIREDEEAAHAFGAPTSLYKWLALIISAGPAGFIGGVYAWNITYISPNSVFGLEIALGPIVMAMLGGSGTMAGPVLGAIFLTLAQELIWTKAPYFHLTMYGGLLILLGLYMPGGLVRTRWLRPVFEKLGIGIDD